MTPCGPPHHAHPQAHSPSPDLPGRAGRRLGTIVCHVPRALHRVLFSCVSWAFFPFQARHLSSRGEGAQAPRSQPPVCRGACLPHAWACPALPRVNSAFVQTQLGDGHGELGSEGPFRPLCCSGLGIGVGTRTHVSGGRSQSVRLRTLTSVAPCEGDTPLRGLLGAASPPPPPPGARV